jgi:hypothetical protein
MDGKVKEKFCLHLSHQKHLGFEVSERNTNPFNHL